MNVLKGQTDKFYRTLSRNMILIIVGVSFAPLFLIGAIILDRFSLVYQRKVMTHLEALIEKHGQNIDAFLNNCLADIRFMARTTSEDESQDLSLFFQRTGNLNQKLNLLREEYGGVYVDLGLVTLEGLQVGYAGPLNMIGANYAEADWFKKMIQLDYVISDVFTGLRGSPHFIIAVKQAWQGRDWILRSTIDFEAFNAIVENLRIGQTGFAFILNRKGEFQTKPRFGVALDHAPYDKFIRGADPRDRLSVIKTVNEKGQGVLVASVPLKSGQWLLCCQQDIEEAFADLRQVQKAALVIMLGGGLIILIVAFILSKKMVGRIAQADREKELMNQNVLETGRLASLGELAAGVAHEINNPMAIMVENAGWMEDLLEDEDLSSPQTLAEFQRSLKMIKTQGQRCKEITHKLLSFARRTDPRIQAINLNDLLIDVVRLIKQKNLHPQVVEMELAPDLAPLMASTSELQQVLLNLVNNAVDAVESTGGMVKLSTWQDGDTVVFEVADTGHGIPEAIMPRIFDPFFTTKPVGKGTGLGLSICYGIIIKMGGEISVKSRVGEGTVFTVRLPADNKGKG